VTVCGFVGAFGADVSAADVERGLTVIGHRGPDGTQAIRKGDLYLASCRLAICPPDDESPLQRSGKDILALNGEIYDLDELLTGSRFTGASGITDTQLLCRVLTERGKAILPALRGLFAFCFSDGQRVLMVRDRFGIKPLYYARFKGGVVFASEMKALLALPGFSRDINEDVVSSIKVVGHNILPGRTPFRHVRSLRPGHFVDWSVGEELHEEPFAVLPAVPVAGEGVTLGATVAAEQAQELLAESVSRTLLHDPQPKAVFFSGGLDSSLLLDLGRRNAALICFVLSDRGDAPDLVEARRVANALGVRLEEIFLDSDELAREIVSYAWHFEQPIAGGAFDLWGGVAFHALARRIGKDHKVAICGEGADELFLGYHRLHTRPDIFVASLRTRLDAATPLVRESLEVRHLLDDGRMGRQAVRDLAVHEGLSEYHLPSVDRSGMAFGLEVRPPYLDNQLAEWAISLEESVLIDRDNLWTKLPLRSIARNRFWQPGTEGVATRRKWAMPSAIELCASTLTERLASGAGCERAQTARRLDDLLMGLFAYLHVDPGCSSPPGFSFVDFVNEFTTLRSGAVT
jgi:asparagine synthase (glutamine-hydrolysing)